jgi:Na+-transporting NADH:ubiquinone oxidoreductase subunit B
MKPLASAFVTMADRFFWSSAAVTRTGPHIRDSNSVQRLWNYFVIASIPAWLIGIWSLGHQTNLAIADFQLEAVPGWRAALLNKSGIGFDAFSVLGCFSHGLLYFLPIFVVALLVGAFWQALFAILRRQQPDEGLLYIAWFLALMMPASAPLYQVGLGMTFGIVVGKLIYGGSGRYLVNPALLGLAFLVFSYPSLLFGEGAWVPVAGYDQPSVLELVSSLGALLGALFLIWTGMASWRVMLGALIGLLAASLLFNQFAGDNVMFAVPWYWQMVLGGYLFGVVFLATDPVAGPMTDPGRWGFGLLVGALTVLIRVSNPSYYEGVMFAILLASMFSPLIDFVVTEMNIRRRRLRLLGASREQ